MEMLLNTFHREHILLKLKIKKLLRKISSKNLTALFFLFCFCFVFFSSAGSSRGENAGDHTISDKVLVRWSPLDCWFSFKFQVYLIHSGYTNITT